jgi:hypothetical protein
MTIPCFIRDIGVAAYKGGVKSVHSLNQLKKEDTEEFNKHRENVRNDVHLDSINIDLIYLNY